MALDRQSLQRLRIDRSTPEPTTSNRPLWVGLGILLLLVLLGFAFWVGRSKSGGAIEVETTVVRTTGGSTSGGANTVLNASGYVTARREATVSAKVTGKVMEVLVEEGKRVEADQVLARLDPSNATANRKLAEAQLGSAKISLKETQALLDQAQSNYKRTSQLVAQKVASDADLDKALSDFKSLQARLERQTLEVSVAERSMELWDQQLEDLIIRAPFAGVVTAKNAQPGEVISPMSAGGFTRTGICTLVDMDSLEIEVDVNESYINRVTPGQRVEATLDAYTDWKIPAKVIAIIPTADRQKATVKVRVGFERLDPRILPQMGVKVAFRGAEESGKAADAPKRLLSKAAIVEQNGHQIVWVVRDGKVERRAIQAQAAGGDEMQVLAGLNAADVVVLHPPSRLEEGTSVRTKR